jgi:hypothetical protein
MIMTRRKLYSRVGWRKYLDPTGRPRVKKFLKTNGTVVFNQVVECIQSANVEKQTEIMILVHPNVQSVVVIEETDFDEVLTHCLDYFQSKELYEECGTVVKLKNTIKKEII